MEKLQYLVTIELSDGLYQELLELTDNKTRKEIDNVLIKAIKKEIGEEDGMTSSVVAVLEGEEQ